MKGERHPLRQWQSRRATVNAPWKPPSVNTKGARVLSRSTSSRACYVNIVDSNRAGSNRAGSMGDSSRGDSNNDDNSGGNKDGNSGDNRGGSNSGGNSKFPERRS